MAQTKLDLKKSALIAGCVSALFALAAFCVALFGKRHITGLWFIALLCNGLYFCLARPYFATGEYKLQKTDNLLYWIFGAALLALVFPQSSWLAIILMALSAISCYIVVYADKVLEPKEYALALVGLAAAIYAVFGLLDAISSPAGSGFFAWLYRVLVSACLVGSAIFIVNDHLTDTDKNNIKDKAREVVSEVKDNAEELAEKISGKKAPEKEENE